MTQKSTPKVTIAPNHAIFLNENCLSFGNIALLPRIHFCPKDDLWGKGLKVVSRKMTSPQECVPIPSGPTGAQGKHHTGFSPTSAVPPRI
jgi:hypothetical protein